MQRAAQQSGDLREDSGGVGTWSDQAHEIHVLPGKFVPQCEFFEGNKGHSLSLCKIFAAESHRALLQWGETFVSRWEEEGLRVRGVPAHAGQIHQHVCRAGWTEEHEVQR